MRFLLIIAVILVGCTKSFESAKVIPLGKSKNNSQKKTTCVIAENTAADDLRSCIEKIQK